MIFEVPIPNKREPSKKQDEKIVTTRPPVYEERKFETVHKHIELKKLAEKKLIEEKSQEVIQKPEKKFMLNIPGAKKHKKRKRITFSKNTSDDFIKDLRKLTTKIQKEDDGYVTVRSNH